MHGLAETALVSGESSIHFCRNLLFKSGGDRYYKAEDNAVDVVLTTYVYVQYSD